MIAEDQSVYTAFLDRLGSAPERVLLLDYDGTLAPFNTNRHQAFPYPEVPQLVARIMASGTRVVLISGRRASELVLLSGVHPHPEIWGSHGVERLWADGRHELAALTNEHREGLALAAEALKNHELGPNMEQKPGGIAVHWRGMDDDAVEQLKGKLLQIWTPLIRDYPLHILNFDGGMEIRALGPDKGSAVREILAEAAPAAAVAYLGDDRTDEDAFRALQGKGLTALVRPEHRATAADLWLKPPEELIEFLHSWLRATGGDA